MGEAALVLLVGLGLGAVFAATDHAVLTADAHGIGVPIRRATRLLLTQRRTTLAPDRLLWRIGCVAVPLLAFGSLAVVPITGSSLLSTTADLVWFNTMEVLLWGAVWLAGWGPNAVHALTGGYRFLAQGLAYELPLMFAIITAGLGAGSLNAESVVAAQDGMWFVVTMPVAFAAFLLGAAGFAFWGPLSAPAGADIAGGVMSELSGVDRLSVEAGRAVFLGSAAAMAATLFLGGGHGPWLPGTAWLLIKTLLVIGAMILAGRRMPVVRPERFMDVAWIVLIPATLVQALAVALLVISGYYG
ncbi:NADH-quinone oxidoreductase subunit H [Phytoactinopolyspora halotolerans]|uniref:NADH-quinone oxidoreductase subunit H n=1 Tax=Phytoactinopolyspora halotolerans TaxID=1981512 RepID=A0A6L9SBV9_9ACTN|nr:NADH-quinone oxidoreductase subunit H [Phytoactinopolyspora halotolerans]NEE02041.1 NADH-quinone oxidoreductase subunit H [Phytoactinopolyspora halotolerans]